MLAWGTCPICPTQRCDSEAGWHLDWTSNGSIADERHDQNLETHYSLFGSSARATSLLERPGEAHESVAGQADTFEMSTSCKIDTVSACEMRFCTGNLGHMDAHFSQQQKVVCSQLQIWQVHAKQQLPIAAKHVDAKHAKSKNEPDQNSPV